MSNPRDNGIGVAKEKLRMFARGFFVRGRAEHALRRSLAVVTSTALVLTQTVAAALPQELPTGGSVAAGSASIGTPQNGTLDIHQNSDRAILHWNSFSVGQGGTVNFHQPGASSATLNRVTGATPSSIAGTINAPGTVLLVNPNGIAITQSGVVNVGSFAASSLDIANEDFMAGRYRFSGNGASAAVSNAGRIHARDGGFVALLGGQVANDGLISARLGRVGLGSGELITLDLAGDGFMQVAVPTGELKNIKGANGEALVSNRGRIEADGGIVQLSAATAANVLREAVHVPGSIRANSVGTRNGKIVLGGGAGGKVRVAGTLSASGGTQNRGGQVRVSGASVQTTGQIDTSGKSGGEVRITSTGELQVSGEIAARGSGGQGGRIDLTAEQVEIVGGHLDASGETDGGLVRVGGEFQGGVGDPNDPLYQAFLDRFGVTGALASAESVSIDLTSTIDVSATAGAGGTAIVWAEDTTQFAGHIDASGTTAGGFAEVSGKRLLDFVGTVDLAATHGPAGTLLLDPYNVSISNQGDSGTWNFDGTTYSPGEEFSILDFSTLQAALESGNVVVTTAGFGVQAGNILVHVPLGWSSANTLTLIADNNIRFDAPIAAPDGGLLLNAANQITTGAGGAIDVGTFTLAGGHWAQNAANLPAFHAGDFRITGGSFLRATGGAGTNANPYQLADIYGLQGINSSHTLRAASYVLANDIDASVTAGWNSGAGFVPIGTLGGQFTGSFDGQGHVISNLYINRPGGLEVGLFGATLQATLENVGLEGGSVRGNAYVGALVGRLDQSVARNVYATAAVEGATAVGGLVGWLITSTLSDSYASGSVGGQSDVGGLVGVSLTGNISHSHASGAVVGTGTGTGGLVGALSDSHLFAVYATGSVEGDFGVGGLAGSQGGGSITQAYATGNVTGLTAFAGGLVGSAGLGGSISRAYATGSVTGGDDVGGLVGSLGNASISLAYATGNVTGNARVGGLAGSQFGGGNITQTFASGAVNGSNSVGGFIGHRGGVSSVSQSYWDADTTGQLAGVGSGATPGDLEALQSTDPGNGNYAFNQGNYDGWNFSNDWFLIEGETRPFGRWEHSHEIVNAHQLQLMVIDPSASYTLAADIDLSALTDPAQMWKTASAGSANYGFVPIRDPGGEPTFPFGVTPAAPFTGSFDGQGHVISGLLIHRPDEDNVGLFGDVEESSIANVGLVNGNVIGGSRVGMLVGSLLDYSELINVSASGSVSGQHTVGGLVGLTQNGTVRQAYATGFVSGQFEAIGGLVGVTFNSSFERVHASGEVDGDFFVGGLIGYLLDASVMDASATGAVTGSGNYVGGLVGYSENLLLEQAYAEGAVEGRDWVGGLVGQQDGGSIMNASATGAVSGDNRVGGLVGNAFNANLSDVHATGNVTGSGDRVAGLVGRQNGGSIMDASATGAVSGSNLVGGLVGELLNASLSDVHATGSVTGSGSQIGGLVGQSDQSSLTQVYAFGAVSGTSEVGGLVGELRNTSLSEVHAAGNVTGSGERIGGLAGLVDGGNITDAYATGAVSGANSVGGLVGVTFNSGIERVHASGEVNGDFFVGGLIGYLLDASITDASATGAVTGTGDYAGGLVGYSENLLLEQAYAEGAVQGRDWVGGLVGQQEGGSIMNAFATGAVSGGNRVGGLAGNVFGASLSEVHAAGNVTGSGDRVAGLVGRLSGGSITQAYATGDVSGSNQVGGLVGLSRNGTIEQAHAEGAVSGLHSVGGLAGHLEQGSSITQAHATGDVGGSNQVGGLVGLMRDASTVTDAHATGAVGGNEAVGGLVGLLFTGSIADVYAVGPVSGNDLVGGLVGNNVVGSIQQALATGTVSGTNNRVGGLVGRQSGGSIMQAYATGDVSGSTQVGGLVGELLLASLADVYATGSVTGTGGQIGGLVGFSENGTIERAYAEGAVSGNNQVGGLMGELRNASLADSFATGMVQGNQEIGGLVGFSFASGIADAHATGTVSGNNRVGGLVGQLSAGSSVVRAHATGAVSGVGSVGGLAGAANASVITHAHATGMVTGTGFFVGGLVGNAQNNTAIAQAYATGDVISTNLHAGGLVGQQIGGSLTQVHATGQVSGTDQVGGLVGTLNASTLTHAYATGDVSGNNRIGGLVGSATAASHVADSNATGAVSGNNQIGGLMGLLSSFSTIERTYATGPVSGTGASIGGLVGDQFGISIVDSHATGDVSGSNQVGGLVGLLRNNGSIVQAHATGTVSGSGDMVGGLVGQQTGGSIVDAHATGVVSGSNYVGGLVGWQENGALIRNAYASGPVSGDIVVGGLVGLSLMSSIEQAYATGAVAGTSDMAMNIGGLVGAASMTSLSDVYATGAVSGGHWVGGLAGLTFASTIADAYATGAVSGDYANIGGLVGQLSGGSLTNAYATGSVTGSFFMGGLAGVVNDGASLAQVHATGTVDGADHVGGLIGELMDASIVTAHATGNVTGSMDYVGGLVGKSGNSTIADAYAAGTVAGLGNTVGGLVGQVMGGSIAGSHATGTVTGITHVGGLAGRLDAGAGISQSYATGAASGSTGVGGLVGTVNAGGSAISQSYASGNVSANFDRAGGLVGQQFGAIVEQSFATGAVGGRFDVGGLVGLQQQGSITDSYATGAVSGQGGVGGLVGNQISGTVTHAFAAGSVIANQQVGGLVGAQSGVNSITESYWNVETTGQLTSAGSDPSAGLTTAELQAGLPAGFDPAVWGVLPGISYPYLQWRFPTGPSVVSGTVAGTGTNQRVGVEIAADGQVIGQTYTGANGYYYFATDSLATPVLAYLDGTRHRAPAIAARGNAVAMTDLVDGRQHATGLAIDAGWVRVASNLSTLSEVETNLLAAAKGGLSDDRILYTANGSLDLDPGVGFRVDAAADFTVDTALATSGPIWMIGAGNLAIGNGASLATTAGGTGIVVAAHGYFRNESGLGAGALSTLGRWLVYSSAQASTEFGGLDSGNTAVWNATFATHAPAGVAAGNRYLFAEQPVLTFTSTDASKTYGEVADLSGAFSVSGFHAGVAGAFLGDTAATAFTGAPILASLGAAANADVGGGGGPNGAYAIDIAQGSLTSQAGYALAFDSVGLLTISPAALTVAANDVTRTYDADPFSGGSVSYAGFVAGDDENALGGILGFGGSSQGAVNVGDYAITPFGLTSTNYAINFVEGALTIDPALLVVTADAQTKFIGRADPPFTYAITDGMLFGNDTLSGLLGREPGEGLGSYAILQGTLAASANYDLRFVSADLAILPGTDETTSQFAPPETNGDAPQLVDISFQPNTPRTIVLGRAGTSGDVTGSIAANGIVADDIVTGTIPTASQLWAHVGGHSYRPISQFDVTHYAGDELPGYADRAGAATIFAMIARAALRSVVEPTIDQLFDPEHGSVWTGHGWENPTVGAVAFSDGSGNTVENIEQAFSIASAKPDFAALLQSGPVIVGNGEGHWLLATAVIEEGIVANDPVTGRQVLLQYNPESGSLGPVTAVYDAEEEQWLDLGEAASSLEDALVTPAALAQLSAFAPQDFLAVTVQSTGPAPISN